MPNPRLASRYAKSLIDLAQETDQMKPVFEDLQYLHALSKESRELVNFIKSPVINADKKRKIFDILFDGRISALTAEFCRLLIRKGREIYLPEIAAAGILQYRRIKNIRQVNITTAAPINDTLRQELVAKIKSEIPDTDIQLAMKVNEDLIGGFVLETDNNLFDASILRDLKDIKKQFLGNVYVRNIR